MARRAETRACEQAGQWISLRLDGELSELERAGLDRHLARCAGCRMLAADLAGIAQMLRSAPTVAFERELARAVPTRRSVTAYARPAAVAAALSAAAAALAFVLVGASGSTRSSQSALEFPSARQEVQFIRIHSLRSEPPVVAVLVTPRWMNPRGLI